MSTPLPDLVIVTASAQPTMIALPAVVAGAVLTSYSQPASGTLVLNLDQSFTYTPAGGFLGADEFAYTVHDIAGDSSGRVAITVLRPNTAPVATPDQATVAAGTAVLIPVLANDNDADGDALAVVAISTPAHGTVSLDVGQQLRYAPQTGFVGDDSFNYTVGDGQGGYDTTAVTVTVTRADGAPVAQDDAVMTTINTPITIAVLANDSDPDGDPLVLTAISLPQHGVLVVNSDQTLTYTPATGYLGGDSFAYQISDNKGGSAAAQVTIQVQRPNRPPVANNDAATTVLNTPVTVAVLANDNDPDGDLLTLVAVGLPAQGRLAVNPDSTITYTPSTGYIGADEFTYTVSDGWSGTATARVAVTVNSPVITPTYPNGYAYRRRLAVPAKLVVGQNVNFPMWVQLAGAWLKPSSAGGRLAGGANLDLRFELEDGTKLAHEVETYSPTQGLLAAWVRVPLLADSADTRLVLYYGKPGLAADESSPATLWADYLAVWHLPKATDAGPAHHNLDKVGIVNDDLLNGLAGDSRLAGSGTFQLDDGSWLNGLAALTVQMRAKADATGTTHGLINGGPFGDAASALSLRHGGSDGSLVAKLKTSVGTTTLATATGLQSTGWQMLALAWAAGDPQLTLYLDGTAAGVGQTGQIGTAPTTRTVMSGPLVIGAGAADAANSGWIGLLDEVRLRAGKLTAGWLGAEHSNQTATDTFYGYGDEDTPNVTPVSAIAVPIGVVTTANQLIDIDVLANAITPVGATAPTLLGVGQPAHGIASIIAGKVRYTPTFGYTGADSFTYTLASGTKASTARISVTVNQQNSGLPTPLRVVPAPSAAALSTALANARAGDAIVLSDGVTYSGSFTANHAGTAQNPVVIRSTSPLGALIKGAVTLKGDYTWLWGVQLPGTNVGLAADGVRMSRCLQTNTVGIALLVSAGRGIEIDHNEIASCHDRGISISPDAGNPTALQGVHIHHNYVHDSVGTVHSNVHEGLQLGQTKTDTAISVQALVEWNLFVRISVDTECISIKSSDNVVQFNTLIDCQSHITNRHGKRNQIIANYLDSCAGMRMHDQNGRAVGNQIINCDDGMEPMAGDIPATLWPAQGSHPACENWIFVGNTANKTIVGYQFDDSYDAPCKSAQFQAHVGPITYGLQTGATQVPTASIPIPLARKLTVAEVGPAAA